MAESNLQKAKRLGEIHCMVNGKKQLQWHNFTLQKNHIFGYSPELKFGEYNGLFVVYQALNDKIKVYLCNHSEEWSMHNIATTTKTAKRIYEVVEKRVGNVVLYRNTQYAKHQAERAKWDTSGLYEQHLVTDPFTPMPHMRIPMGKRGKTPSVTIKKSHDFRCESAREVREKRFEMKRENLKTVLNIAHNRAERVPDAIGIMK